QRISSMQMPLPEVLQLVAETVQRQSGARGAVVELLEGPQLVTRASAGDQVRPVGHLLPAERSMLWPRLSQGRTVVCNDTGSSDWDMAAMPHRQGVMSFMAVPLRA